MAEETFQVGETIQLALRNLDGAEPSEITAKMVANVRGAPSGEPVLTFDIEEKEDLGDDLGPGWLLTGPSDDLEPRSYFVDARLVIGESIIITDPRGVRLVSSASG